MLNDKEGLVPAIVLTVVAVVTALLLALTFGATKETIAANAIREAQAGMQSIFPTADTFDPIPGMEGDGISGIYTAFKGEEVLGYVVQAEGTGYGGPVPVIIGFNPDETLAGVTIANTQETPGYGKKAEEAEFQAQFVGMPATQEFTYGDEAGKTQFDQVSGATATSIAIRTALNTGLMALKETGEYGEPITPTEPSTDVYTLEELQDRFQALLPAAETFEEVPPVSVAGIGGIWEGMAGSDSVGHFIVSEGQGFAGKVPVIVAFNPDDTIAGISIADTGETEGYGKAAEDPTFLEQFKGLPGDKEFTLGDEADMTHFDQVSGATATSIAVKNAMNQAVSALKEIRTGVPQGTPEPGTKYALADFEETFQSLLPEADSFEDGPVSAVEGIGGIWVAKSGSDEIGHVVISDGSGFAGTVPVVVAFNPDQTIAGVSIRDTSETEGYGKGAEDPAFLDQFTGMPGDQEFTLTDEEGKTRFDQVSGATATSIAIKDALNQAVEAMNTLGEGGAEAPVEKYPLAEMEPTFKELLPDADSFEAADTDVEGVEGLWIAKAGSETVGYVAVSEGHGFGGTVPVVVAFTTEETLAGVSIKDTGETPGYGQGAEEPTFLDQFKGMPADKEFTISNEEGKTNFDQVSGATSTNIAVKDALNNALQAVQGLDN